MSKFLEKNNIKNDILSGLTGAMLLGSYSICTASSAGLGIWNAFFCIVICALFSSKSNNKLFAPDAFLLMPILYVIGECSIFYLPVTIIFGTIIYFILQRFIKDNSATGCFSAWASLLLALIVTVMLTNQYFGIGATGSTAVEMLQNYRSLGFHPHFRGLLYGTITLFAMITYPFKYKKLNKVIPAEFITLLIPLLLNLFLNPQKELTTVNEIDVFSNTEFISVFPVDFPHTLTYAEIPTIIIGSLFIGTVLYLRSTKEKPTKNAMINLTNSFFSFLPVRQFDIVSYSPVSAIITIAVSGIVIFLFHSILSRIPMHCVGALLIVSAWQQVPYKNLRRAKQ